MFVRQRLTLGLSMVLGLIGWMAVPMPAQSGAQPAQAGSSIVDAIRFREIGPTRAGRTLRRVRGRREQPARVLRRDRDRRAVENREQRHQLHVGVRQPARLRDRCGGAGAEPPGRRLRRHRRVEQLALHLRRQRHLQVGRRRQDLDEGGPAQRRPHRPHRRPPEESRHRLRRGERTALLARIPDRGVYRSTDGGATWTKTLDHKVDGRAIGAIDIAMDPVNPNVALRRDLRQGPQAVDVRRGRPRQRDLQVHRRRREVDAADQRASDRNDRPHRHLDRAQRSQDRLRRRRERELARRVAARGARQAHGAGLRRRLDRRRAVSLRRCRRDVAQGGAGRAVPAPAPAAAPAPAGRGAAPAAPPAAQGRGGRGGGFQGGGPPYYYGQIRVDPKNKEHVYLLSVGVTHTTDGGKTWTSPFGFGGDNHALWINPTDSESPDPRPRPRHGRVVRRRPHLAQPRQQAARAVLRHRLRHGDSPTTSTAGCRTTDRCAARARSRAARSIPFEAWYRVGGGDGFYNVVDPTDSRWLYNESQFGAIQRMDQQTGQSRSIRYSRPQGQEALRWNWSSPILLSPHNPEVVYHAANVLLRSSNRGDTWTRDQPRPDEEPARAPRRFRQHPVRDHHDDRRVADRRRRDLGRNRRRQRAGDARQRPHLDQRHRQDHRAHRPLGEPRDRIESRCRHRLRHAPPAIGSDDFKPFVWKTTDYGATWTSIAGNLPNEAINVIREDRKNPNLLFVGTDFGALRVARRRQGVAADEERDHDQPGARPRHPPARPGAHRRHARTRHLHRRHLGSAGADAGGARAPMRTWRRSFRPCSSPRAFAR